MTTSLDMLQEQQDAFDAQLETMLAEHQGEFVLFAEGRPQGFFDTYPDAYSEGLGRFGLEGVFIVDEVRRREPCATSLAWESGVMFTA